MLRKFLALSLLPVLVIAAAVADNPSFPGIEKLMSPEEYDAAGLEQLSEEQIDALNSWLLRYTAGESAVIRQQTNSAEMKQAEREFEIVSRIEGGFRGWSGDTLFRLENGQVWRQRTSGRYTYVGPPNPEVKITKNFLGYYKMTLTEKDRGVGVKLVN